MCIRDSQHRAADGALLAGVEQASEYLLAIELLAATVLLDDHIWDLVDALVGSESLVAALALAAAADRIRFFALARVDHAVLGEAAVGALHRGNVAGEEIAIIRTIADRSRFYQRGRVRTQAPSDDPTSARDFIAIVEDSGLAGGDGTLRLIEGCADAVAALRMQRRPGRLVSVADLDADSHLPGLAEAGDLSLIHI